MKKIAYRISAFMMAVLFCITLIPFAFASSGTQFNQTATFLQWAGSLVQDVIGYSFGMACPNSEDGYHHSSTYDHKAWLSLGDHYICTCDYCGASFEAYESDLQQSYDEYVSELPATGYTSAGGLIWDAWNSFTGAGTYRGSRIYSGHSYFDMFHHSKPVVKNKHQPVN